MKTYQRKEPEVRAAKITGLAYTLDDGTTQAADATPEVGSYFVVAADGTPSVIDAATFEAQFEEVPTGPLA